MNFSRIDTDEEGDSDSSLQENETIQNFQKMNFPKNMRLTNNPLSRESSPDREDMQQKKTTRKSRAIGGGLGFIGFGLGGSDQNLN